MFGQIKQQSEAARAQERMKKICEKMIQDSKNTQEKKMENTSGIRPTEFMVLVKVKEVEEKTAGGIIKLQETLEREQHAEMEGIMVDMSPMAFTYEEWNQLPGKMRNTYLPKRGDRILFSKYAGSPRQGKDGELYRLVSDKDIKGILED
jgi:co-chaperonin GroES (HSP10)